MSRIPFRRPCRVLVEHGQRCVYPVGDEKEQKIRHASVMEPVAKES